MYWRSISWLHTKFAGSGPGVVLARSNRTLADTTPSPVRIFDHGPLYVGLALTRLDVTAVHPNQIYPRRGRGTIPGLANASCRLRAPSKPTANAQYVRITDLVNVRAGDSHSVTARLCGRLERLGLRRCAV
jgi:hypothetical protein